MVVLVIAFLTPLFDYIPNAALAAVIIMAVTDMTEFHEIVKLWNSKRKCEIFLTKYSVNLCIQYLSVVCSCCDVH
jgi:MFS superfamily sulfate permease-like transporter